MLSNRAAGGKSRTRILPLKPLGFLTFWLNGEEVEGCLCETSQWVLLRFLAQCENRGYIPRGSNPFTDSERFNDR